LDTLQQQVADAVSSVQEAGRDSRDQLKRRIEQAQADRDQAIPETERSAPAPASKWDKMRADAADKMDEIKARIDKRNQKMGADMSATDADLAEFDAGAAIDLALWTVGNARLAVLDAIDARAYADARAGRATF
jgi:hypothetical protein